MIRAPVWEVRRIKGTCSRNSILTNNEDEKVFNETKVIETMGKIQNGISDLVILKNRNTKYSQICILNIVRLVIEQYFLNFSSMGTSFLTYNVFYRPLHGSWKWKKVKVTQSCPTLCNPMDYTALGILQARRLDWVAFPFSRGSSQPRDLIQVSLIAGELFTSWATREAHTNSSYLILILYHEPRVHKYYFPYVSSWKNKINMSVFPSSLHR